MSTVVIKKPKKKVVEKEASIDMSNISIFNPSTKKADKIKILSQEDGSRKRVYKSSGKEI